MGPEEAARWALDYQESGLREDDQAKIDEFQAGGRTWDVSVKLAVIRRNIYWYISSGGECNPPSLGDDLYDYFGNEILVYNEEDAPFARFSEDFWVSKAPHRSSLSALGTTPENKAKLDGSTPDYRPKLDGTRVDLLHNISESISITAGDAKLVTSGGWEKVREDPERWKISYEAGGMLEQDEGILRNGNFRTREYGDAWKRKNLYRQINSDYTETDLTSSEFGDLLYGIFGNKAVVYGPGGIPYIPFGPSSWYTSLVPLQQNTSEQAPSSSPGYSRPIQVEFEVGDKIKDWTADVSIELQNLINSDPVQFSVGLARSLVPLPGKMDYNDRSDAWKAGFNLAKIGSPSHDLKNMFFPPSGPMFPSLAPVGPVGIGIPLQLTPVVPLKGAQDEGWNNYWKSRYFATTKESRKAAAEVTDSGLKYTQTTASTRFSEAGTFSGKTIGEVANDLKTGVLKATDIPVEYIERDGVKLVVNTRSSLALRRAGIPESEWNLVNKTGDAITEAKITERLARNELTEEGIDVIRITGAGRNASSLE